MFVQTSHLDKAIVSNSASKCLNKLSDEKEDKILMQEDDKTPITFRQKFEDTDVSPDFIRPVLNVLNFEKEIE